MLSTGELVMDVGTVLDGENAVKVMELLSNKLEDNNNASAIIVSHDMHLAVTFADIIVKIKKEIRPKKLQEDEDIAYGVIDKSCIFQKEENAPNMWTNGITSFENIEFEDYLRKK